jgi:hypothetical protein
MGEPKIKVHYLEQRITKNSKEQTKPIAKTRTPPISKSWNALAKR